MLLIDSTVLSFCGMLLMFAILFGAMKAGFKIIKWFFNLISSFTDGD